MGHTNCLHPRARANYRPRNSYWHHGPMTFPLSARKFDRGAGGHMKISLLLADAAQADAQSGKVNALGLGWRQCQTRTPAFALVLFLDIDWDETNKEHRLKCQLLTTDGDPVMVRGRRDLSGS